MFQRHLSQNSIVENIKILITQINRESQVANRQTILAISNSSLIIIFLFIISQMIEFIILEEYYRVILTMICLTCITYLLIQRNKNVIQYFKYILYIMFTFGSLHVIYISFIEIQNLQKYFWIYESIIGNFVILMSYKFQLSQRFIFHLAQGVLYSQDTQQSFLSRIYQIFCVIFDIYFKTMIFYHSQDQYQNLLEANNFLFSCCPETLIYIEQTSKNQFIITKSNKDNILTYEQLNQYFQSVNPISNEKLPLEATSIINLIEKMLSCSKFLNKSYDIKSIINQGQIQESNLEIIIFKYSINYKNKMILRLKDDSQQQQIIKVKEYTLKSIYHDIKNSLIGAQFENEQVRQNLENDHQIQLDNIQKVDYYLVWTLNLINSYLDYCQSQVGILKISYDQFNLYESITFIQQLMSHQARQRSVQLYFEFNQKEIFCRNDEKRLHQVLMNLINNAIKFTKTGGRVQISVKNYTEKNIIFLSVKDSGVGMSPEILSKIGSPNQTFNQNQMNSHGNGIGLNSVQNILRLIGPCDKLFLNSQEEVGSEISFLIYQNAQDNHIKEQIQIFNNDKDSILSFLQTEQQHMKINIDQEIPQEECEEYESLTPVRIPKNKNYQTFAYLNYPLKKIRFKKYNKSFPIISNRFENIQNYPQKINDAIINDVQEKFFKPINILIVDDEQCMREILSFHVLRLNDHIIKFKLASDGQDAINLFKMYNQVQNDESFHLIFTDIQMSFMTGYQMSESIQNLINYQGYAKVDIIAISSDQSEEHDLQCQSVGIKQSFTKPLKFNQFKEIINSFKQNTANEFINIDVQNT